MIQLRLWTEPVPYPVLPAVALLTTLLALAVLASPASAVRFDDVAPTSGLAFARAGDAYDLDPTFVELMGGGACWLDYDRDGELDVFLVNGWYNDTRILQVERPTSLLFRNLGPGAGFADVAATAGLDVSGWTQACSAADYDGDGWTDLFVAGYDIQRLFRNAGDGTFAEATAASGISAAGKCPDNVCWGSGSAWADYNHDSCLDLYVINFVAFDIAVGGPRGPGDYDGQPSQLYRNDCDGTFTDVTAQAGADGDPGPFHGKNWGVSWLDYDRDGWLDIYVASDGTPNILYRNNGDGTFTDKAVEAGVDDERNGMGLTISDCNEDGYEDLFFTHYRSADGQAEDFGYDGFYVNNGNGTFADRSGEGDLQRAHDRIRWGTGFEDFDNDGDVDLHLVAGNTEPLGVDPSPAKPMLFLGDGECHWTDVSNTTGPDMQRDRMARGTAYADYDHDGVMDILQVNLVNQAAFLLRGSDAPGHWLTVELRQPGGNPQGIMATVDLTLPDGRVQHRTMNPYQSIHGNNAPQVHFGLGDFTTASVTVGWPGEDVTTTYTDLPADRIVRLFRDGRAEADTLAPRTQVLVDGAPPEQAWFRQPVTLTLPASDAAAGAADPSGVATTTLDLDGTDVINPGPTVLGEGLHRIRVHSTDGAGNVEPATRLSVGVDGTAPTLGLELAGTLVDGWYRGPVHVTLPCADATSGVAEVAWRLDLGPWTPYAGTFDLTRPGAHILTARCTDAAGNVAERAAEVTLDLGHPETVAVPAGTPGQGGWWRSDVTVALEAEAGLANVTKVEYRINGGPAVEYVGGFQLQEGVHVVTFHAEDDAQRVEPERTLDVRIDSLAPAITVRALTRHVERPDMLVVGLIHAIEFAASDGGSGVALVEAHREGEAFRVQPPRPMKFLYEGRHTLSVRATDGAGNVALRDRDVHIDLTPPVVGIARPLDRSVNVGDQALVLQLWPFGTRALVAGPAPMEADPVDDFAGVRRVFFLVNGETVATVDQAPWVWNWSRPPSLGVPTPSIRYVAEDGVGNRGAADFVVTSLGNPLAVVPQGTIGTGPLSTAGGAPAPGVLEAPFLLPIGIVAASASALRLRAPRSS